LDYTPTVQVLVATSRPGIVPPMARESVDAPEQKLLGRALRMLRKRADLTTEAAGERFGISGEGWRKYEAGLAKAIFSPETQLRLTAALGTSREQLMEERARLSGDDLPARVTPTDRQSWVQSRSPELTLLPIRDPVQAGAWLTVDDYRQDEPATYPAARDPRFPHASQWLAPVRGDSVNKLNIVDGDLVHLVDAIDAGYYPRTGDVVEVERLRFGGQERELTLKQIEVTAEGVLLWPRSTNPRWQSPIEFQADTRPGEEIEVRIRALVLASIRRF
jgi:transcriptional regulator with XRE-family HTH domain